MIAFFREFLGFLRARARYWLIPLLILIALVGGLLIAVKGSSLARAFYRPF
ncbi:MAG TPA: DUF5989 family protein [Gemmatimonadaceae bacterium]|nr:DUF5989 family protein [Gemmatimonadaceae bacterium]